jgi:hypothetical protein
MLGLASTGRAIPNAGSEQDAEVGDRLFKVRYQYAPLNLTFRNGLPVSREFCVKMVGASKIYRKEDIMSMSEMAVNAGWGPNGASTYDIWLYKGGGKLPPLLGKKNLPCCRCYSQMLNNPNAEISVNKARREGLEPQVNDPLVAKRPVDMPNQGFLNPR